MAKKPERPLDDFTDKELAFWIECLLIRLGEAMDEKRHREREKQQTTSNAGQ